MAIRYSGDCEVRVLFVETYFVLRFRAPKAPVYKAMLSSRDVDRLTGQRSRVTCGSPESYDRAALAMILLSERKRGKRFPVDRRGDRVIVRRMFVSPCPLERT